MSRTIEWVDAQGLPRLSVVPDDAGVDDAPLGIPVSYPPEYLPYPEPLRTRLYTALWEEGFKTVKDFARTDALEKIHQVVKRLNKLDANDIRQSVLTGVEDATD